jgi:predicted transcriptional regulator
MSPTKTGKTEQLTVRLDHETVTRIDGLAKRMSHPGLEIGRADVLRMAVADALPRLEAVHFKRK